jgi:hypothetical protein
MSPGEIRPSGETAVASVIMSPAPPTALVPRWTRCQSFVNPSFAIYWHIGDITILFFKVIFFIIRDENNFDIMKKYL